MPRSNRPAVKAQPAPATSQAEPATDAQIAEASAAVENLTMATFPHAALEGLLTPFGYHIRSVSTDARDGEFVISVQRKPGFCDW